MRTGLHLRAPLNGWDLQRWPNFSAKEFACKCGKFCQGEYFHDPDFLDKFQALRNIVGKPLRINSGRRCRQHNTVVTKNPNSRSMHTLGIAGDVSLAGHDHFALLQAAHEVKFMGIGLAATFIHLDNRPVFTMWDYGKESRAKWGISSSAWELAQPS